MKLFNALSFVGVQDAEEPQVVGYVLGRMDDQVGGTAPTVYRDPRPPPPAASSVGPLATGHVTSLAVLPAYRRCGVARELMSTLHDQASYCGVLQAFLAFDGSCLAGDMFVLPFPPPSNPPISVVCVLVVCIPVAPVAYQVILEPGICQFR